MTSNRSSPACACPRSASPACQRWSAGPGYLEKSFRCCNEKNRVLRVVKTGNCCPISTFSNPQIAENSSRRRPRPPLRRPPRPASLQLRRVRITQRVVQNNCRTPHSEIRSQTKFASCSEGGRGVQRSYGKTEGQNRPRREGSISRPGFLARTLGTHAEQQATIRAEALWACETRVRSARNLHRLQDDPTTANSRRGQPHNPPSTLGNQLSVLMGGEADGSR